MANSYDLTPNIYTETSAGVYTRRIVDEMLADREIELVDTIDSDMANSVIRQLRYLQKQDGEAEITLYINSFGGEVSAGLAVYDVMNAVSCPVCTVCLGMAANMASLLFVAGDKRDMLPHSRLMLHDPLVAGGIGGGALSVKAAADDLMRIREIAAEIYSDHIGKTVEEVYELTAKDTYFEAQQAVEFGLADNVIETL